MMSGRMLRVEGKRFLEAAARPVEILGVLLREAELKASLRSLSLPPMRSAAQQGLEKIRKHPGQRKRVNRVKEQQLFYGRYGATCLSSPRPAFS